MRVAWLIFALMLAAGCVPAEKTAEVTDVLDFDGIKIKWLGHSAFKITDEIVIYIDPYDISDSEKADLILITHEHYDHCSSADAAKISKDDTMIITTIDAAKKLKGNTKVIKAGDNIKIKGVLINTVQAYNIGKAFHPKGKGVGFIITLDGKKIYHAGDTDLIPEMDIVAADIALLPIGGTYTMDAKEAAQAANKIKPKIAIPMHWGKIVGGERDAEQFRKHAECEVRILAKNE